MFLQHVKKGISVVPSYILDYGKIGLFWTQTKTYRYKERVVWPLLGL